MKKIYYLRLITFLAAFLLFQIELIISKILLPKFGGSYLVWGAAVVFFQCALLLGYWFSHQAILRLGVSRYRYLHLVLMLLPLLIFPGRPLPNIYTHSGLSMVLDVFTQLIFSIGLVFFVLSTVSIIFQSWLAASHLIERVNPYALYAVSNLGSFLALLTYPFVFEVFLDLKAQLIIWRIGYLLLVLFYLIAFKAVKVINEPIAPVLSKTQGRSLMFRQFQFDGLFQEKLRWFLFSAAGCIAFLSVTNIITYEITPCPLLWIIPLCIYLVSFVLNFKAHSYCPAWIREKFHFTIALSIGLFFITQMRVLPFALEMSAYCVSLFSICMFCQYQLVTHKPRLKEGLTGFYLIIATGSFLGSILAAWVIPLFFTFTIEFLLSLFIIALALMIKAKKAPIKAFDFRLITYLIIVLAAWPLFFNKGYNIFGLSAIIFIFIYSYAAFRDKPRALFLSLLLILIISPIIEYAWTGERIFYMHRNYYGIYRVYASDNALILRNGTTVHGAQYLDKEKKKEPLTYYHRKSPVGKLMESKVFDFKRTGIVGLGAGTLAAYGKKGGEIDFFEIDPDALTIAEEFFTYTKDSLAKINYIVGDARVTLKKVPDNHYDLLVIDAFSGDSVPVHLLTIEAIEEYKRVVTKKGIVLLHISNRYLTLMPVLASDARLLNAHISFSRNNAASPVLSASLWAAMTWDADVSKELTSKEEWLQEGPKLKIRKIRPWTDAYSNILSIFLLRNFIDSIKHFKPFYW